MKITAKSANYTTGVISEEVDKVKQSCRHMLCIVFRCMILYVTTKGKVTL